MKYINFIILISFCVSGLFILNTLLDNSFLLKYNLELIMLGASAILLSTVFFIIIIFAWLVGLVSDIWSDFFALNFGLAIIGAGWMLLLFSEAASILEISIFIILSVILTTLIQIKKIHYSKIFILSLIACLFIVNISEYFLSIHIQSFSIIFGSIFFALTGVKEFKINLDAKNKL